MTAEEGSCTIIVKEWRHVNFSSGSFKYICAVETTLRFGGVRPCESKCVLRRGGGANARAVQTVCTEDSNGSLLLGFSALFFDETLEASCMHALQ